MGKPKQEIWVRALDRVCRQVILDYLATENRDTLVRIKMDELDVWEKVADPAVAVHPQRYFGVGYAAWVVSRNSL